MIRLDMDDPYLKYYTNQAGSGVSNVYRGAEYQRGHGIGSFLGGLFRSVTPLLSSGVKALGKEALRSGIGFVGDLAHAIPAKEAIQRRVQEMTGNLKRRADSKIESVMTGYGYKRKRKSVTAQSIKRLLQRKSIKRKPKRKQGKRTKKGTKKTTKKKKVGKRKYTTVNDIFD